MQQTLRSGRQHDEAVPAAMGWTEQVPTGAHILQVQPQEGAPSSDNDEAERQYYEPRMQRALAWAAIRAEAVAYVKRRGSSKADKGLGKLSDAQRGRQVTKWHRQQSGAQQRAEAARVTALQTMDYAAYLKLAQEAKSGRIREVITATDTIMTSLIQRVGQHQKQDLQCSGAPGNDAAGTCPAEEGVSAHQAFYDAVHSHSEPIEQSSWLCGGTLREYQLQGVQFLLSLHSSCMNGVLADEMGLGKTIQAIAYFAALMQHQNNKGPFLVLAPKAVLSNWASEFDRWLPSDQCKVVLYDGPQEDRKYLQQESIADGTFNVLLTHYQLAITDKAVLGKVKWEVMLVDEGHRLKNERSRLFSTLNSWSVRRRFLLTGTPIQNTLSELWALLHFLLPTVFASHDNFDVWFAAGFVGNTPAMEEEEQLLVINRLHAVLRPLMLRRTKAEVATELPAKMERVVRCPLSAWQRHMYRSMSTTRTLGAENGTPISLSNVMMHLRKVCLHPALFYDMYHPATNDELISASGKLLLLHDILPKLQRAGHRVLLFSQFTTVLDLLQHYLEREGYRMLRLDGSTKTEARAADLAEFNRPDSPYLMFLLSTRAGGVGLNLQSADTVIIFDQDWNPQMDLQAEDRVHRIGQKKQVLVLVLVCSGSVEEAMLATSQRKRSMDAKVIKAGMFNNESTAQQRQQVLQDILRKGSHAEAGDKVHDRSQVNELIARSDEELALFQAMDNSSAPGTPASDGAPRASDGAPRASDGATQTPESKTVEPRTVELMTENEIPAWALQPAKRDAAADLAPPAKRRRNKPIVDHPEESSESEGEAEAVILDADARPDGPARSGCTDELEAPRKAANARASARPRASKPAASVSNSRATGPGALKRRRRNPSAALEEACEEQGVLGHPGPARLSAGGLRASTRLASCAASIIQST